MASSKELSNHIDRLMFIQRMQEKDNQLQKLMEGKGVLPSGGGLGHGGGLGRGGGLEAGGFYQRKFAVRQQMLDDEVPGDEEEKKEEEPAGKPAIGSEEAVDVIQIQGKTSQPWKKQKKQIEGIHNVHDIIKGLEKKEFGSQTKTKAVIVIKDGSNEVLKYRSLGDLARQTKMSKYSLVGKLNVKSVGDNVHSSKLGGTLVFVNKSDLVNF